MSSLLNARSYSDLIAGNHDELTQRQVLYLTAHRW
jgi:hypothetical protein